MGTKRAFRPKMTYVKGAMRPEDQYIALYVVQAPFDQVKDMLGGLFCAIDGPAELIEGDARSPFIAQDDVYREMRKRANGAPTDRGFNGMVVWQPHEAPHLTVIEKPLDAVGTDSIYLPKAISQFDPSLWITAFHSEMEVKSRTLHGFSVRQGNVILRDYEVSKGIHKTGWHEIDSGTPIPWENTQRRQERQVSKRLDRTLLLSYVQALGIDLERSLYGRDFAQSFSMLPLLGGWPHDDRVPTRVFQDSLERARDMGIVSGLGEEGDDTLEMHRAILQQEAAQKKPYRQKERDKATRGVVDTSPVGLARAKFEADLEAATTAAAVCAAAKEAQLSAHKPYISNTILTAAEQRIVALGLIGTDWLDPETEAAFGDEGTRDAEKQALLGHLENLRDGLFDLIEFPQPRKKE